MAKAAFCRSLAQKQGAVSLDRLIHLTWGLSGGDSVAGADDQQPYVH
jgi:hypothetical protein